MNPAALLDKPTYWFQPSRVFSRLKRPPSGLTDVKVAWGSTMTCNASEDIGRMIVKQGVYDLVVSEAICRLLQVGGIAVDVGANVGHMTGLMAKQAGTKGQVISFEPSSRIRSTLSQNVARWSADKRFAPILIKACAVSDQQGTCNLYYPPNLFGSNEGTASLSHDWAGSVSSESEVVEVTTLDNALHGQVSRLDVLKIDVEGHELGVLRGATEILSRKLAAHIIFEDFAPYPSSVHQLLEQYNYKLYRLARNFVRLEALEPDDRSTYPVDVMWNYLATVEPQCISQAFSRWGWVALNPSFR